MFTVTVFRARQGGVRASLEVLSQPEPYKVSQIVVTFTSDVWEGEELAIVEVCQRYRAWLRARSVQ
jgi:hypothetical protein